MSVKSFRAEVLVVYRRWILRVPSLDNLRADGHSLLEAEQTARRAIAERFGILEDDICLELQDRRDMARTRERRTVPSELSRPKRFGK